MKNEVKAVCLKSKPNKIHYFNKDMSVDIIFDYMEDGCLRTLDWGAYHLFDSDFHRRYTNFGLTNADYVSLIDACIDHSVEMIKSNDNNTRNITHRDALLGYEKILTELGIRNELKYYNIKGYISIADKQITSNKSFFQRLFNI